MEAAKVVLGESTLWWKYRRWENGERDPSVEDALRIETKTGVRVDSWSRRRLAKTGTEG